MDKSWITAVRTSAEYMKGVKGFIEFAEKNAPKIEGKFYCPCRCCMNMWTSNVSDIFDHLICNGFNEGYTQWIWHGEVQGSACHGDNIDNDEVDEDRLGEMFCDVGEEFTNRPEELNKLATDAEKPLWPGCSNYTRLSAVLKLFNLKARNGWSDKSFTALLEIIKDMLPEGNEMPKSTYEAKKIMCPMGMNYQKIHACVNDCILFRNEYEGLHVCPKCGASRYKKKGNCDANLVTKGSPAKVLWYLPIIPRFKRMFSNPGDAENLTWHADQRCQDGKIRHPADSPQWKLIDNSFPEFGNESRNLRLGLCTDGINPHGNLSSKHSSWPVILVIYNLPPGMCMKRKYMMLSLMISGPKQPGNDIDVFLAPMIEDLNKMWDEGVMVFDAYRKESFKLRAMLFCTINDFLAYGNLSGYSVKGHKACPICEDGTCYHQLEHGRKTVYMGHRRFLSRQHPYRRHNKNFNGLQEFRDAPKPLTGDEVYERVKDINVMFGKTQKQPQKSMWKKKSIFFDLPYWKVLFVRHSIDVMHVEKNVCDSLIGTLLNIKGKTKDGVNARLDLIQMGIRAELAPESRGKRMYLPPAQHTLSRAEKISFCECLSGVKVPQWYSSNIRSLVSMKDLKLIGLKSHDCHVLMQQLLPVAIRNILPKKVRQTIIRLCFFFNAICAKVIDPNELDDLENGIIETLCQLEMYFPPSFFDIMVHLMVHLVREIRLCGPAYLRYMYPFERDMKVLKGYVRNRYRPEACIVESYIAEEVIDFCSGYLKGVEVIGVPKSRHETRSEGKGTRGLRVLTLDREDVYRAHLYILNNTPEIEPLLVAHKDFVKKQNPRKPDMWVLTEHNRSFSDWFANKVLYDDSVTEKVRWLAAGPKLQVWCYTGYDINGYSFYTKSEDDKSTVQNSGLSVTSWAMHFSSSKDKNPVWAESTYYGVIEEIWEIDYITIKIPVFLCRWVDSQHGKRTDEFGFTLVDLNREGHKEERFILATQAKQVFYVTDPSNRKWSVVLHGKRQIIIDDNNDPSYAIDDISPFSSQLLPTDIENEVDGFRAARDDHHEGTWEHL